MQITWGGEKKREKERGAGSRCGVLIPVSVIRYLHLYTFFSFNKRRPGFSVTFMDSLFQKNDAINVIVCKRKPRSALLCLRCVQGAWPHLLPDAHYREQLGYHLTTSIPAPAGPSAPWQCPTSSIHQSPGHMGCLDCHRSHLGPWRPLHYQRPRAQLTFRPIYHRVPPKLEQIRKMH